jgi:kynurenine formamidase
MQWTVAKNGFQCRINPEEAIDIASTYGDSAREPRAWGVPPVAIEPVRSGDFTGRVTAGAPINFFHLALNPHGNGTHTEGVGHIDAAHTPLQLAPEDLHAWARMVRLPLRTGAQGRYLALADFPREAWRPHLQAVILPVELDFPQDFTGQNAPHLEPALCAWLREQGVQHLITNLPSVDPEEDGGALAAHRAWWHYPEAPRHRATITELAHLPAELPAGDYWLELQVAPVHNDAAPSRPLLYPLRGS